jgi:hypothetical protein
MLFPIFYIFAYAGRDPNTRTPGISLIVRLYEYLQRKRSESKVVKEEKFSYSVPATTPKGESSTLAPSPPDTTKLQ